MTCGGCCGAGGLRSPRPLWSSLPRPFVSLATVATRRPDVVVTNHHPHESARPTRAGGAAACSPRNVLTPGTAQRCAGWRHTAPAAERRPDQINGEPRSQPGRCGRTAVIRCLSWGFTFGGARRAADNSETTARDPLTPSELRGQVHGVKSKLAQPKGENADVLYRLSHPATIWLDPNVVAVAFFDQVTSTPWVSVSSATASAARTCPTPAACAFVVTIGTPNRARRLASYGSP
jgi:hypothetical protein